MNTKITIAIDGFSTTDKSTLAKQLAKHLGYIYVDTGAMYRALTLAAITKNIDLDSEEALMALLTDIKISFTQEKDGQHVHLNDEDVTLAIRNNDVTNSVSKVSAYKSIREEMVIRQHYYEVLQQELIENMDEMGELVINNNAANYPVDGTVSKPDPKSRGFDI